MKPATLNLAEQKSLVKEFDRWRNVIDKALLESIDPDYIRTQVISLVASRPELAKCDRNSFFTAVLQACQLNLSLHPLAGQAYIVPFYNSKEKKYIAQLIIGYKGHIELVYRTGVVRDLVVETVYEGDDFSVQLGSNPEIYHVPRFKTKNALFYYAVVHTTTGGKMIKVMSKQDIEEVKKRFVKSNSQAWIEDFDEMAKKTVLLRISKLLPHSPVERIALTANEIAEKRPVELKIDEQTGALIMQEVEQREQKDEENPRTK